MQKENTLLQASFTDFLFFSFQEETELMDALKCWDKSILFQCII